MEDTKEMTLQHPKLSRQILCHKCGAPITFNNDHISPITKREVPLDPWFNNEPHAQHCMYFNSAALSKTDTLLLDFLSLVPNKRQKHRIIGAVGKANANT